MSTPAPAPTKTKAVLKKRMVDNSTNTCEAKITDADFIPKNVSVQTEDVPDTVPVSEQCDGNLILDKTTKNFHRYTITNSIFSGSIYVPKDYEGGEFLFIIKK